MEENRRELNLIKRDLHAVPLKQNGGIDWRETPRKRFGENAMKNMAVASALVICAVTLRSGALPQLNGSTDVVLAAATGDVLLDENLGKLSFVSSMFPEATLVFGQQDEACLAQPVPEGELVHAWSEAEPYAAWDTAQREVSAVMAGEVSAIFHGNGEERVLQVMTDDGYTSLYGNLESCMVTVGDTVKQGDVIGVLLPDTPCVLEIKRLGCSVDPLPLMNQGR